MKRGFTIIELLTVMMIMGLMGTIAVGGYRAMQRGMEERGVMQNMNAMIRAAYQRAQIDRQPTAVFMWNETLRGRTADENEVVVGHAVAVRRHGRLSNVKDNRLVDEFADLNLSYPTEGDENSGSAGQKNQMYIYPMDNLNQLSSSSNLKRSKVRGKVYKADETLLFLSGETQTSSATEGEDEEDSANKVPAWAFYLEKGDAGGVSWKPGMAYGFEFISITLPDGYIFGSDYSTSADNPIRPAGTLVFKPGVNSGNGRNTGGSVGRSSVTIYSLRPDGAMLKKEAVGETDSPEGSL